VVHEPALGAGAGLAETGDPVAVPETVGNGAEEAVEVAGALTTVLKVVAGTTVLAAAELAAAELACAELASAELTGAEDAETELADTELVGAELTGAELTGAVVETIVAVAEALLTGVVVVPTIELSVEMRDAEVELKVTDVAVLDGVLEAEVLLLDEETASAGQVRSNKGVSLSTLPTMPKLGLGVVG